MKRLLVLLLLASCQKASDSGADKQMPKLPPPPAPRLREDLRIAVEVDGQPQPPLDSARLSALKPDFADEERRAWTFRTLLGPAVDRPGTVIAITGQQGLEVALRPAKNPTDPAPVLYQSRRGDVVAAMVTPSDPFPNYHGQGRRMARPGDPLPRIQAVTKIRVYVEAAAPTAASLSVFVGGKPAEPWSRERLAKVAPFPIRAEGGAARDAWSLHKLCETLVGEDARVVELRADGARKLALDARAWADRTRTPVLRLNREGQFKFQWVDKSGAALPSGELRNVRSIWLQRGP